MKIPVELFDAIIDNVTEAADLLSLGLTCKYLAKSILRDKLFYHTISGFLHHNDLWIYLIMNPEISRYIRRLQVTKDVRSPNRKMRLPIFNIDLGNNHPYQRPQNITPLLWSYQLLSRALSQMVNLKALEWSINTTPVFDANSDIGKDYPNLRILKQVINSLNPMRPLPDGSYISIFDTPIIYSSNLVSLTITAQLDALDSGKSIIHFLTGSLGLKYLKLLIVQQAFVGDLISFCRWPNMQVLSLLIDHDRSKAPKKESIIEFIGFHSNIVSLEWNVYLDCLVFHWLSLPLLAPNHLPQLRAIDGNKDSVRSVVLSPCIPPRPLKKIIGFPTDVEVWDHLESFKNICQSSLRIVVIPMKSIYQLTTFAALFPNVESIDIRRNDLLRNTRSKPNTMEAILSGLSCLKRLRVILGIPPWEHDRPEEVREDNKFFSWIHVLLPRLEFWGEPEDGVVFTRDDNNVSSWHWVHLPPSTLYKFRDREKDFTIREECDRFAS